MLLILWRRLLDWHLLSWFFFFLSLMQKFHIRLFWGRVAKLCTYLLVFMRHDGQIIMQLGTCQSNLFYSDSCVWPKKKKKSSDQIVILVTQCRRGGKTRLPLAPSLFLWNTSFQINAWLTGGCLHDLMQFNSLFTFFFWGGANLLPVKKEEEKDRIIKSKEKYRQTHVNMHIYGFIITRQGAWIYIWPYDIFSRL